MKRRDETLEAAGSELLCMRFMGRDFAIRFGVRDGYVKTSVMDLLGDYFKPVEPGRELALQFTVSACASEHKAKEEILEYGRPVVIHNSKRSGIHEEGLRLDVGLLSYVWNKRSKGLYILNRAIRHVRIFNQDRAELARDTIRVTRDLAKSLVETVDDAILIHSSSAVSPEGKGVLICGAKGSGKSTLMLNLIYQHGFKELSRDRTFVKLKSDGGMTGYGYPQYYNLTLRTMATFDATRKHIDREFDGLELDVLGAFREKKQYSPQAIGIGPGQRVPEAPICMAVFPDVADPDLPDVLAEETYTPCDLNYPDWHNFFERKTEFPQLMPVMNRLLSVGRGLPWKANLDSATAKVVQQLRGAAPAQRAGTSAGLAPPEIVVLGASEAR